jgi:AraC-like DNA-binding protein
MPWRGSEWNDAIEHRFITFGVFDYYSSQLGDPSWMLEGTTIEGAERPFPRFVECRDYWQVVRNFVKYAPEPDFHIGRWVKLRLPVKGGLSLALHVAPSLRDGLELYCTHFNAAIPFMRAELVRENDLATLHLFPLVDNDVMDYLVENGAYRFQSYVAQMRGANINSVAVRFAHPPHLAADIYRQAFGDRIMFGQKDAAVVFPAAWLDENPGEYDPGLWQLALNQCALELEEVVLAMPARRVLELIRTNLRAGEKPLSVGRAAELFGHSARSLNRRLSALGTSYEVLSDHVQKARAQSAIIDRTRNLATIAEELGFADQSSFGRSFRRWFGIGPEAYRKSLSL